MEGADAHKRRPLVLFVQHRHNLTGASPKRGLMAAIMQLCGLGESEVVTTELLHVKVFQAGIVHGSVLVVVVDIESRGYLE